MRQRIKSSVQIILAIDRIANFNLSPLAAANRFVRSFPHPTWFVGLTRVSAPNGISIGSAVFAKHTRVTNTQTDTQTTLRATYVATGRIYELREYDVA